MSGWVATYRAMFDHPLFEGRADRVGVWVWMVAKAAWKDTPFRVDGKIITLKRGQLCVSQSQISDETGVSRRVIRTLLEELEAGHAVRQKPAIGRAKGRKVITICNYDKYQSSESAEGQAKGQRRAKEGPTKEQENKHITSEANASEGADAPTTIEVSLVSAAVWKLGKQFLASRGIENPGSMIGRWLKSHPPLAILGAFEAAQRAGTQDPIPYITEALKDSPDDKPVKPSKQSDRVNAFIAGARSTS